MAHRCPSCGEKGLRDKAQFCDNCGTRLIVSESQAAYEDDGATSSISTDTGLEDDGATSFISTDTGLEDDGATSFISTDTGLEDDGATSFISTDTGLEDENATDSMSTDTTLEEAGVTGFMPKDTAVGDDGETRLVPKDTTVVDDGATSFIPGDTPLDDHGDTLYVPGEEVVKDSGATSFMPDDIALDQDGATQLIPGDRAIGDDGATSFMPTDAVLGDEGATMAMPDITGTSPDFAKDTSDEPPIDPLAALKEDTDFVIKNVVKLHNRYHLNKILGKGGFGAVFLAEDIRLKRRCVVKQMLTRGLSPREIDVSRANFEREANLLVDLNDPGHPNIPEIYDHFSADRGNYLVMKYIEGQNLKNILGQGGAIPWREAVRYAIDVCSALNYMHTHGSEPVLHRDVKPANIQLGDDGRVWLVDFGLAKADPAKSSGDDLSTQASGSFGYTPLEQWIGKAVPASDIYAVGATLHHLVTGMNPIEAFGGKYHIQKIQELHGVFPSIRQFDRKLPPGLDEIISHAVAADPNKRPTAFQLQQQLEAVISEGQGAALYTFKDGRSAKTVEELADLCEQNRREAEEYLYEGDFERWFSLINRNDLAAAASQAVKESENRREGLEKFLSLILPNLFRRRLKRFGLHVARGSVQFVLIAIVVVLLLAIGSSYVAGLIIQQSIASTDWAFHRLDLDEENHFDEAMLTERFNDFAGVYFDDGIKVDLIAPDRVDIETRWNDIRLYMPLTLRLEGQKPHFYVNEISGIPLFFITDNISRGINRGVDEVFQKGPVDMASFTVEEDEVIFFVERSGRAPFATPTPAPTPTPTPAPTPTPVDAALVVVFNELDQDVILEIEGDTWDIAAGDSQVIVLSAGTYNYTVRFKETGEMAAPPGTRTWTLNQAYRLRIGLVE